MKQAELTSPKKFQISEVETPKPSKGQAMFEVHAVGICGSDIHAYYGLHPFISCPIVMGHEAAGKVVAVGEGVTNLKVGDHVILRPQKVCGECTPCKSGRYNICEKLVVHGCGCTGACSDYYVADADLLYVIPDDIDYGEATLLEPFAVGLHAAKRGCADLKGKKVLVTGAGTIGNMVAQSAKCLGAAEVMITDISDFKLDLAAKSGIDYTVNTKEKDLAAEMLDRFGKDGADVAYECSASEYALNQLLSVMRKGTTIIIAGVYEHNVSINMANVQDREYALLGSLMYTHEDYAKAIEMASNGKVDLKTVITNEYRLSEIAEAYKKIENDRDNVQKIILRVRED
jgi:L-iditol 2-dehydrogenase